jgi:acetyl esterase/lipase
MRKLIAGAAAVLAVCGSLHAQNKSFDAAAAFGARPNVMNLTLSPDGNRVAFIAPLKGQGTGVVTRGIEENAPPRVAAAADGKPLRVTRCSWVTNHRLVCDAYGVNKDPTFKFLPFERKLSFDDDGGNSTLLGNFPLSFGGGFQLSSGDVIDSLPDAGAVLIARRYVPGQSGMRRGTSASGLGIESLDTRTLASKSVEPGNDNAVWYLADGHGTVRVMALDPSKLPAGNSFGGFGGPGGGGGPGGNVINYVYRAPGNRAWHPLSTFNIAEQSGFRPVAIDAEHNLAYGLKKKDGHLAVYTIKLEDSLEPEQLVFARGDTDITGVVQIGRSQWVVAASYVAAGTTVPSFHYFDSQLEALIAGIGKAVPDDRLNLVDASEDHSKLLLLAYNDADPGYYYIFDRNKKQLSTFLPVRTALEDVTLASVKAVSYPAGDGVSVSATLYLPPHKESAKGLPAIVLPYASSAPRDPTGFDWLAHFFANRGFAVLQPSYRGEGFGEIWSLKSYPSWSTAVGDVLAGGRWLVSTGLADPGKLATVGWSSGGYAALQSAVVDPDLFKAVVAVAPVTDLGQLKEGHRMFPDFSTITSFVGSGGSAREGSPVEHAATFKAPVLLFHGGMDMISHIEDSRSLDSKLKSAGKAHELVVWEELDHQLEDADARAEILRKSDAFLRKAIGM